MFSYIVVGGVSAAVDFGIFFAAIYAFQYPYLWAGVLGFLAATFVNYLLCVNFVFVNSARFKKGYQIAGIYMISGTALLLHQSILYLGVDVFAIPLVVSKFGSSGGAFYLNYWGRRCVLFKDCR